MKSYTYPEAESIDQMYDAGYAAKTIAEQINKDFHNEEEVRNERSVRYVINKIYNEDAGWYERLESKWLETRT